MFKGNIKLTSNEDSTTFFMNGDLEIKVTHVLANNRLFIETNIKHDDNLVSDIEFKNPKYPKDEYYRLVKKLKFALINNKMVTLNISKTIDEFLTFYTLDSLLVDEFED